MPVGLVLVQLIKCKGKGTIYLEHELLSVNSTVRKKHTIKYHDGKRNVICTSVSFPLYDDDGKASSPAVIFYPQN